VERIEYGDEPSQHLELYRPEGAGPWAVVVLVHGGFWRIAHGLELMRPMVGGLVERGLAVANIEYRRVGEPGGGWPGTLDDVAAAIDALDGRPGLDTSRVVTAGHSAGGHLAVWAAARHVLSEGVPGADPLVDPIAAVSMAGVVDLLGAAAEHLGGDAAQELLGGEPSEVGTRYQIASPMELVPIGVPVVLVHGTTDDRVPVAQSEDYEEVASAAGDAVELITVEGADHFSVLDPTSELWQRALAAIERLI
jgi:acetyl esterase/lipase